MTTSKFTSLKKIFQLYTYIRPYRWKFALGLLFLILSSLANLIFPKLLGDLVDASQLEDFKTAINQTGLFLVLVLLFQSLFSFFRIILFVQVTEYSLASLRKAAFEHLIYLPISFYNERRVGELSSRLSNDIVVLQETMTTTLAEFLRQLLIIVGGVALLAYTSWKLTLFMLAILPPIVLITMYFGRYIRSLSKKVQDEIAGGQTILEETLQGIYNVKIFVNEWFEEKRYGNEIDKACATAIKTGIWRGAFASFIILGLFGAMVAVLWKGTTLIASGELATGQLFSFVIYSGFIGGSIGGMADIYTRIQKAIGATEELLNIFEYKKEESGTSGIHLLPSVVKGHIIIKDLSFSYPTRKDIEVLKSIRLEIFTGEKVALVGSSGGGKSTLIALLCKLYENYEGDIFLDGISYRHLSPQQVRKHIAVVPQEVLLFGGTIRDNIAYGKPTATEQEIIEAAKSAFAWNFIEKFPEKLDTIVGERGVQLSGGQRQRIAIARAIIKNPSILILDEATSSLDSESEYYIQLALEKVMKGRTSIIIAHRLSTIKKVDKIVVLDHGKIAEIGSHEELLIKNNSMYKKWHEIQNFS
ncbi:MAG: ABC transporter ATP-binding protein [Thermaurantimonas sp.]